jgi:thiamine biosynthesis lipoprotein
MKRSLSILALLVLIGAIVDRSLPDQSGDLRGSAMGTGWHLRWRGDAPDREVLRGEVAETLEKWEQVFSQWRDDSDLSRFNRGGKPTDELQRVIELAQEIKSQSSGAFDPGLLQETGEAGFGPEGVGVDLSGIGKGYAVDRVAEALTEAGLEDFLFELGGEIIAVGGEWEVGIERPDPSGRSIARTVKLKNQALATSGNYRQFRPAPGGFASHIIDPRTGKPVVRPPCSVSVIAGDCATADAWATALFVLGKEISDPPGLDVQWNDPKTRN